jgi:hypothetical protein
VCAGEPASATEKTVASGTGLTRARRLQITSEPPTCTSIAEHLLPEVTGLFRVSLAVC